MTNTVRFYCYCVQSFSRSCSLQNAREDAPPDASNALRNILRYKNAKRLDSVAEQKLSYEFPPPLSSRSLYEVGGSRETDSGINFPRDSADAWNGERLGSIAVMTKKTKNAFAFIGCVNLGLVALIILVMAVPVSKPSHDTKNPVVDTKATPKEQTAPVDLKEKKDSVSVSNKEQILGRLSTDDEEKLRLKDFKGFLHYKSRLDGARDRELMGLSPEERHEVINERVKAKILKTLAARTDAPSS